MRDKNMLFKKSNISYIIDDGKPKKSKEIRHSLDYHIEKNKQKNKPADNILKELNIKMERTKTITNDIVYSYDDPAFKVAICDIANMTDNHIRELFENLSTPIDLVFPYVDSDDPEWQIAYNNAILTYKSNNIQHNDNISTKNWKQWSTGQERFRSNDLLKYVFRSIEINMKFINNIYMIVMDDSLVPKWINRSNVKIVYHKDFIPKNFLPTFNSSTIEMFLHKIPNLSEYFIYGNDDMFFTSPNYKSDYFNDNNVPIYQIKSRKRQLNWVGDILRYEDKKLVCNHNYNDDYIDEIQHIWTPYFKSTIKEVYDKYKEIILNNSTQFREKNNYNQWIFSLYQYYYKKVINKRLRYFHTELKETNRKKYDTNWRKYKAICLNDSNLTTQKDLLIVNHKFENMFPNKSKYEI